jgi:hypothetical protein
MSERNKKPFKLSMRDKINPQMYPVIQNLVAIGCSETDIGLILGYAGKDIRSFLANRKRTDPAVKEACEMGKHLAKIIIVKSLMKVALGYEYTEIDETHRLLPNGKLGTFPVERKVKRRYAKPDVKALELLAYNLLQDDFKRKMEVENKSVNLELSGEVEKDDIRKLAGKLLELADIKKVESKEIEPESN